MNFLATLQTTIAQAAQQATPQAGDTQWMVWAIIAFGVAFALLVVEAFLPSGGVISLVAIGCAITGIFMFFRFDTTWGMLSIAVSLAATPFIMAAFLWFIPNSPFGRAITLETKQQRINHENGPDQAPEDDITVGLEGKALTELRPVGACRLNGQRIDCIAQAGMIGKGTAVQVVAVDGSSVKVKPV